MNRMRVAPVHKITAVGVVVAFLLLATPLHLAAQERGAPVIHHVPVIDWFAEILNDLTTWLGGEAPQQPDPPTTNLDNGCIVDPHGGCGD